MVQKEDNELKNPLRNGIIKRIHVNQHNIRQNKNSENQKPVITCKTSNSNIKCNELAIYDKDGVVIAKVVYSPDKPLSCGAKVWLETCNEVKVVG